MGIRLQKIANDDESLPGNHKSVSTKLAQNKSRIFSLLSCCYYATP